MPCSLDPVVNKEEQPDKEYESFALKIEELTGIRLRMYKEKQMKRRINTLMSRKGLNGYDAFITLLESDSAAMADFINYITINVTEFFRTPEHWNVFENTVISELPDLNKDRLRIWSCACATGEEPYSLAISLCRKTDPSRIKIIATDVDETVIRSAQRGLYSEKSVEPVPKGDLERFFEKKGDLWSVSDEVRSCVEFRKLDLLKDEYPADCDLIVCRNVLIYFTEEAKDHIYRQIKCSLGKNGYLFTGNTEQIIYYKKYGLNKITGYLYKNK